jgi:uncharacterized protein (DUF58 family)
MSDLKAILKKVKRLEMKSRRRSNYVFAGEYHSAFKGRGMMFKEVREYMPGDDIRFIDWNVSARLGHPYSKLFEEERSLTVMLLLDVSASMQVGTRQRTKHELMLELAATLAFAALNNNDKVGAICFTDRVELLIPPAKGKAHILYLLRMLLSLQPVGKGSDAAVALHLLMRTQRHTSICCLLSDFAGATALPTCMKPAAVKHDCIAMQLFDHADLGLPPGGLIQLVDAETGEQRLVDTRDPQLQQAMQQAFVRHSQQFQQQAVAAGWDYLRFRTDHDFIPVLQQFFLQRIQRRTA